MITGLVNAHLEGTIRLTVRGSQGQRRRITAVVDTGYSGALTLPLDAITELGLAWMETVEVVLGDGSTRDCDSYAGMVFWDRRPVSILVDQADTAPLVGMELMRGFVLNMEVRRRGQVTIKPLRRRRAG